jgi:hypothetical protein
MSIFNKVLQEHQKQQAEKASAKASMEAKNMEERARFKDHFSSESSKVAKPLFEEFVLDAIKAGYPASIEEGTDGHGYPYILIRFIPYLGAKLGAEPSKECVFQLKAILTTQRVEHATYFDQRVGKDGAKNETFGSESINTPVLERELSEFLSLSLNARDSAQQSIRQIH